MLSKNRHDERSQANFRFQNLEKYYQLLLGKRRCFGQNKYKGLELTDQILKTVERIIEKLIRQHVNKNEIQVVFMPITGTTDGIFIIQEKYLTKKNLYSVFADLENAFYRVQRVQDIVYQYYATLKSEKI